MAFRREVPFFASQIAFSPRPHRASSEPAPGGARVLLSFFKARAVVVEVSFADGPSAGQARAMFMVDLSNQPGLQGVEIPDLPPLPTVGLQSAGGWRTGIAFLF